MNPDELQSYNRFMKEHLFDHVDIDPKNAHVPTATVAREKDLGVLPDYEKQIKDAGGLDFQLLGIGRTGHVGSTSPARRAIQRTRLITLDASRAWTRRAISSASGTCRARRSRWASTRSCRRKKVVLMAWGEGKAPVIKKAVEGRDHDADSRDVSPAAPAARIVLDTAAAAELTRFKTPWLLGSMEDFGLKWDDATIRKAAIWLSRHVGKPLLKLTDEDYNEHGCRNSSPGAAGRTTSTSRSSATAGDDHRLAGRQAGHAGHTDTHAGAPDVSSTATRMSSPSASVRLQPASGR
jgi:glucosamine-6-phosphate deaminase